jgi:class 3 adenylate cyclase/Flp pilus assembly protein TadD
MAEPNVTRKLAAILSVDMVGYSRLMEKDEQETIAREKAHREKLIGPEVTEHHGRIVKTMGDGLLIEFPSVVEAFQCALDVQNGMAERNMDVPDHRKMLLRIGINVGDVIIEGDDIVGDGVIIAARLQEMTDAGGVTVSATAYYLLVDKFDVALEDAGVKKFKNIARPIRTWRWPVADPRRPTGQESDNRRAAYDYFLTGREHYWLLTKADNAQAKDLLKRALELSPEFAPACAYLAETLVLDYVNQWSKEADRALEKAYELAQRAVTLDETSAPAHTALGSVNLWRREHDQAMLEHEKAIMLDPTYAAGRMGLGRVLHYAGRSEEAIEPIEQAMILEPYYPGYYLHVLAQAQFQLGWYERAIESLTRRITRDPKTDISRVLLAASYGHLDRIAEARSEWAEALRVNPRYSLNHRKKILPYKNPHDLSRLTEGLRKANLPPPPYSPRRWDF